MFNAIYFITKLKDLFVLSWHHDRCKYLSFHKGKCRLYPAGRIQHRYASVKLNTSSLQLSRKRFLGQWTAKRQQISLSAISYSWFQLTFILEDLCQECSVRMFWASVQVIWTWTIDSCNCWDGNSANVEKSMNGNKLLDRYVRLQRNLLTQTFIVNLLFPVLFF
jgi:hypothetical protein